MRWHFTPQRRERRVNRRYPLPTKNEPPMRGSYTPPEFVPENQGFPIWRNDFGAKNGAQAKRRVEAYLHTRESPLSRSNSFLAQKHSPNQKLSARTSKKACGCAQAGHFCGASAPVKTNPQLRHFHAMGAPFLNTCPSAMFWASFK